jgi:hypothetical protein
MTQMTSGVVRSGMAVSHFTAVALVGSLRTWQSMQCSGIVRLFSLSHSQLLMVDRTFSAVFNESKIA